MKVGGFVGRASFRTKPAKRNRRTNKSWTQRRLRLSAVKTVELTACGCGPVDQAATPPHRGEIFDFPSMLLNLVMEDCEKLC